MNAKKAVCTLGSFSLGNDCVLVYDPEKENETLAVLSKLRSFRDKGFHELSRKLLKKSPRLSSELEELLEAVVQEIARIEVTSLAACRQQKTKASCEKLTDCTWNSDVGFFRRWFGGGHCLSSDTQLQQIASQGLKSMKTAIARMHVLQNRVHLSVADKQELATIQQFISYLDEGVEQNRDSLKVIDQQRVVVSNLWDAYKACAEKKGFLTGCSDTRAQELLKQYKEASNELQKLSLTTLQTFQKEYGIYVAVLIMILVSAGALTAVLAGTANVATAATAMMSTAGFKETLVLANTTTGGIFGWMFGGLKGAAVGATGWGLRSWWSMFWGGYLPFKFQKSPYSLDIKLGRRIKHLPLYYYKPQPGFMQLKLKSSDVPKSMRKQGQVDYVEIKKAIL